LGIGTPTGPTTRSPSTAGTSCRYGALVPEGTVRVASVAARGRPSRGPALEIGPGFRRRYYLAASTGGIETVLALDEQGQQLAHFPWFPDPQPQSSTGPQGSGAAASQGAFARLIHFVAPRSRRTIARVACRGKLNLPWLLRSRGAAWLPLRSDNRLLRLRVLTRLHVGPRERPWR
jgi:hypothetical protein